MSQFPLRDKALIKAERLKMPTFTLLACDDFALPLIRRWIRKAQMAGTSPHKVAEAKELVKAMGQWRADHRKECKVPD